MEITRTGSTTHLSMEPDEVAALLDDLGGIRASEISAAGDQLHGLLESAASGVRGEAS